MTTKRYCVKCGNQLDETNYGRFFCKNCGILEDNQETEETKLNEHPSYIR